MGSCTENYLLLQSWWWQNTCTWRYDDNFETETDSEDIQVETEPVKMELETLDTNQTLNELVKQGKQFTPKGVRFLCNQSMWLWSDKAESSESPQTLNLRTKVNSRFIFSQSMRGSRVRCPCIGLRASELWPQPTRQVTGWVVKFTCNLCDNSFKENIF